MGLRYKKKSIKHDSRFSDLSRIGLLYILFGMIDHTKKPAGVTLSNLNVVTSSLRESSCDKALLNSLEPTYIVIKKLFLLEEFKPIYNYN